MSTRILPHARDCRVRFNSPASAQQPPHQHKRRSVSRQGVGAGGCEVWAAGWGGPSEHTTHQCQFPWRCRCTTTRLHRQARGARQVCREVNDATLGKRGALGPSSAITFLVEEQQDRGLELGHHQLLATLCTKGDGPEHDSTTMLEHPTFSRKRMLHRGRVNARVGTWRVRRSAPGCAATSASAGPCTCRCRRP